MIAYHRTALAQQLVLALQGKCEGDEVTLQVGASRLWFEVMQVE